MFQEINEMIAPGQTLTVEIHKTNSNMTVSVIHKDNGIKDEAAKKIEPLLLTGTAEELDAGFLDEITSPIRKTTGILSNMKEYEEKAEKASQSSKAEKEKTDKINNLIKGAEKHEEDGKLSEALAGYRKVLEIQPDHPKASKRVKELEVELKQTSLF